MNSFEKCQSNQFLTSSVTKIYRKFVRLNKVRCNKCKGFKKKIADSQHRRRLNRKIFQGTFEKHNISQLAARKIGTEFLQFRN